MFRSENSNLTVVGLYVWRGNAYVPTKAQFESGAFVDIEPVYVVPLTKDELLRVIRVVNATGHLRLPDPKSREEFLGRKDPVLAASGARSWKQLARSGAFYTIGWTENTIRIDMSSLDKMGRWEFDPRKVRIQPANTPTEDVVDIILDDIKTRPEVFS